MEISILRKALYITIVFRFLLLSSTSLVILSTLVSYVLLGNKMEATAIFVSMLLIYMLKTPFMSILHLISCFIQGLDSISKAQQILESNEIEFNVSHSDLLEGNSVQLTNASFAWAEMGPPCLQDLNLDVPKGSLIAIVGHKGSGKSSLLRALLGELRKVEGFVTIAGEMAYVAEEAWIQNMTLEKNIVFLKPKEEKTYRKVMDACALNTDIENLPAGDETEIGKMGIQLSFEQRLKVELARVIYENADVYLLDDPLKCLSMQLAEHLYNRVIGRSGILKDKTRIFVTSRIEFLPLADNIIFLKDGRIVEQGTYCQLAEKNGHFSNYLESAELVKHENKMCSSSQEQDYSMNDEPSIKNLDFFYSTAVSPAKSEFDNTLCSENPIQITGLDHKLSLMIKTIGYISIIIAVLAAGIACACEVASGVWLSEWIDLHGNHLTTDQNLIIYSSFIIAEVVLTVICGVTVLTSTTMTAKKFYSWLLNGILRSCQTTLETTPPKKILHIFNKDFHYLDEKIPETFYIWIMTVLRIPALLVVVYFASPLLSLLSVPLIFAFFVTQKLYLNAWQQLQRLTRATTCPLSNLLEDTLTGVSNIRATNSVSHFFNRFHLKMDTHNNCTFLLLLVSRWLASSMQIVTSILVLLATIMTLQEKTKGSGLIALAIVYAFEVADCLTATVYLSSMLNMDLTSLERLNSFSQIKQESEWEDPANKPPDTWPEEGKICFENLNTSGDGIYPQLHNVNISVEPGERVAIVGKEESGTSTLLYTLFRIIEPSEGRINIDNIDICTLGLKDLRSRLAIIPQDVVILNETVRFNLDPRSEYKDEALWNALEIANLKSYVGSLDQPINDQISSEERRRIDIVRCLLKKPKVVIIQEPEVPDPISWQFFQDSTILLFSEQPLPDFDGRIIKLMSGEVVVQDYSAEGR